MYGIPYQRNNSFLCKGNRYFNIFGYTAIGLVHRLKLCFKFFVVGVVLKCT
jgi:hypothetical protein